VEGGQRTEAKTGTRVFGTPGGRERGIGLVKKVQENKEKLSMMIEGNECRKK